MWGVALTALGRTEDACRVLREALSFIRKSNDSADEEGGAGDNDERSSSTRISPSSDLGVVTAALRRVVVRVPIARVCEMLADAIAAAEAPSPFATSARDGKLLKPVHPAEVRMTATETARVLLDAAIGREKEWREEIVAVWISSSSGCVGSGRRARHHLATARGRAYLKRGHVEQALRDARVALAYAPEVKISPVLSPMPLIMGRQLPTAVSGEDDNDGGESSCTVSRIARRAAAAHALYATALEAAAKHTASGIGVERVRDEGGDGGDEDDEGERGDGASVTTGHRKSSGGGGGIGGFHHLDTGVTHASTGGLGRVVLRAAGEGGEALIVDAGVAAAIERRRAWELAPDDVSYADAVTRAARQYLAAQPRKVLVEEGAEATVAWLDKEKWANAPEYVRPRPKYYYLYEWMRERIGEHYPALPEPVMDKLLALDSGELDLLLQYPRAIKGQVEEYLEVYRKEGGKYLETYRTPQLSWEEVKALKGQGTVGLGAAGETTTGYGEADTFTTREKEGEEEEDTDRALLGAHGDDGGMTAEEAAGLVMNGRLSLPPDQLRAATHTASTRDAGSAAKYLPAGTTSLSSGVPARGETTDDSGNMRSMRVAAILGGVQGTTDGIAEDVCPLDAATVAAFAVAPMDEMD